MIDASSLPLPAAILAFAVAALVIAVAGVYLTRLADVLADRTGLGEAVTGAVLLGACTSISGITTSVTAAAAANVDLAYSNAVGGIAGQTAFLALADIAYRRANLEHAAAESSNLVQTALLLLLLLFPLLFAALPEVTLLGVHPGSLLLPALYVVGLRATADARARPMWRPTKTADTREDKPEARSRRGPATPVLVGQFLGLVLAIGVAGFVVAKTGARISTATGISESIVGALFTAIATSLPELVTTVAAARRGALQLAVGGIIGGNMFDVLFLAGADVAYRDGSIYHGVAPGSTFWLLISLTMTAVLLLGLLLRERRGIARIGSESAAMLLIYGAAVVLAATAI